jgi:hypothetical protein
MQDGILKRSGAERFLFFLFGRESSFLVPKQLQVDTRRDPKKSRIKGKYVTCNTLNRPAEKRRKDTPDKNGSFIL